MNDDTAGLLVLVLVFVAGATSGGAIAFAWSRLRTRAIARKLDGATSSEAAEASGASSWPRLRVTWRHAGEAFPVIACPIRDLAEQSYALVRLDQGDVAEVRIETSDFESWGLLDVERVARVNAGGFLRDDRNLSARDPRSLSESEREDARAERAAREAKERAEGERIRGALNVRPDCDDLVRDAFNAGELGAIEPAKDPPPKRRGVSRALVVTLASALMYMWIENEKSRRERDRFY